MLSLALVRRAALAGVCVSVASCYTPTPLSCDAARPRPIHPRLSATPPAMAQPLPISPIPPVAGLGGEIDQRALAREVSADVERSRTHHLIHSRRDDFGAGQNNNTPYHPPNPTPNPPPTPPLTPLYPPLPAPYPPLFLFCLAPITLFILAVTTCDQARTPPPRACPYLCLFS